MSSLFRAAAEENKRLLADRLKLFQHGYQPIPIVASQKKPLICGWTKGEITPDRLIEWTTTKLYDQYGNPLPEHLSTGLRTGDLVGIDIDLVDQPCADGIRIMVEDFLGTTTPLVRVGSKGFMLCYYNPGPTLRKMIIGARDSKSTLVEIFGSGGQFVSYGIHPTTQQPYRWTNGYEPLTLPLHQLPQVSDTQLTELHGLLIQWLTELDYKVRGTVEEDHSANWRSAGELKDAEQVTDLFASLIPGNARRDHNGFYTFHCPYDPRHLRSGLIITSDGGFRFRCFNAHCPYHDATGWSPGGGIGQRVKDLYALMGGDPDELPQYKRINHTGYDCVDDMLRDQERLRKINNPNYYRSLGI